MKILERYFMAFKQFSFICCLFVQGDQIISVNGQDLKNASQVLFSSNMLKFTQYACRITCLTKIISRKHIFTVVVVTRLPTRLDRL